MAACGASATCSATGCKDAAQLATQSRRLVPLRLNDVCLGGGAAWHYLAVGGYMVLVKLETQIVVLGPGPFWVGPHLPV